MVCLPGPNKVAIVSRGGRYWRFDCNFFSFFFFSGWQRGKVHTLCEALRQEILQHT